MRMYHLTHIKYRLTRRLSKLGLDSSVVWGLLCVCGRGVGGRRVPPLLVGATLSTRGCLPLAVYGLYLL